MSNLDAERWVHTWQAAGLRLEAIRLAELDHVDVAVFIRAMNDSFGAVWRDPLLDGYSGLVEQQRLFGRLVR